MKMLMFNILVLITSAVTANKYCKIEQDKCDGDPHIACTGHANKEEATGQVCHSKNLLPMKKKYQDLILEEHNWYRNRIASGGLGNFPPATRMRVMVFLHTFYTFPHLISVF